MEFWEEKELNPIEMKVEDVPPEFRPELGTKKKKNKSQINQDNKILEKLQRYAAADLDTSKQSTATNEQYIFNAKESVDYYDSIVIYRSQSQLLLKYNSDPLQFWHDRQKIPELFYLCKYALWIFCGAETQCDAEGNFKHSKWMFNKWRGRSGDLLMNLQNARYSYLQNKNRNVNPMELFQNMSSLQIPKLNNYINEQSGESDQSVNNSSSSKKRSRENFDNDAPPDYDNDIQTLPSKKRRLK